ncbi:MAG: nucleotidyl transferase AbiEii/AbiGii toxin family protein [Deltaproteobacteria bacterium]|nr:nucleotidyl transferase AbiEii/AbiGii toxin family protein [Deltaproteobacteria bacterium]
MTRTWPSIAAGTEPRAALLAGWLRRARARDHGWIVRGSIATATWCPDARPPVDIDYLVPGDAASFDAAALGAAVRAIAAVDDAATTLVVGRLELIWAESPSPGLRAHLMGSVGDVHSFPFQLDLAVGDPMCVPPRPIDVADVGPVLACAPETLVGWKLHGLCEFGRGRWRAKDLFDLDLLWRHVTLDRVALCAAIELAFASRGLALTALDDFRTRADWGCSLGGRRRWRTLARAHPAVDDFLATRERVRAGLATVL